MERYGIWLINYTISVPFCKWMVKLFFQLVMTKNIQSSTCQLDYQYYLMYLKLKCRRIKKIIIHMHGNIFVQQSTIFYKSLSFFIICNHLLIYIYIYKHIYAALVSNEVKCYSFHLLIGASSWARSSPQIGGHGLLIFLQ